MSDFKSPVSQAVHQVGVQLMDFLPTCTTILEVTEISTAHQALVNMQKFVQGLEEGRYEVVDHQAAPMAPAETEGDMA